MFLLLPDEAFDGAYHRYYDGMMEQPDETHVIQEGRKPIVLRDLVEGET